MSEKQYRSKIQELLSTVDIQIDGSRPWDLQVKNDQLFGRILGQGSLGLGEAYMEGWWDCEELDGFFYRIIRSDIRSQVTTLKDKLFYIHAHLVNRQKGKRAFEVGEQHYDVGNDLYERMLDKNMIYTCGYWQDAKNLDEAQEHKLELVCRKLKLEPGMRVLDIGCGWGGAARYMAKHYDVEVVGVSVSQEQVNLANEKSKEEGVNANFIYQDYRDVNEEFDRIYSLGMFEHVGFKNYQEYFEVSHRCLKEDGLFLLHTIGHWKTSPKVDPWIERYIFPNSILPSSELISKHTSELFSIEDWHNFGLDYITTLEAWDKNSKDAWADLPNYDEEFQRKWHYYLMCCSATFQSYRNHLWQIVLSKGQQKEPYKAVRSAV